MDSLDDIKENIRSLFGAEDYYREPWLNGAIVESLEHKVAGTMPDDCEDEIDRDCILTPEHLLALLGRLREYVRSEGIGDGDTCLTCSAGDYIRDAGSRLR